MSESHSPVCYFNGTFLPLNQIRLHPYDLGFLRGYSVFDVMPVINGKPFLFTEHWQRLAHSADMLSLALPVNATQCFDIMKDLIRRNADLPCQAMTLRTVLSGGIAEDAYSAVAGDETFVILVEALHPLMDNVYTTGVKLRPLEYARQFPLAKTVNHIASLRTLQETRAMGALETVYVQNGLVLEASTSNVAIIHAGSVIAPKEGVLGGVTLGKVLELANEMDIPIERRPMTLAETLSADEVFLTASSKRVVPVTSIGDHVIANGLPGPITQRLMTALNTFIQRY
ncbi:MAG: aminotransferase class IV [Minisyncoccota bacterium]